MPRFANLPPGFADPPSADPVVEAPEEEAQHGAGAAVQPARPPRPPRQPRQQPRRHRTAVRRPAIEGITKNDIRRLARKGGVKLLSAKVYEETRTVLREFLYKIVHDAVEYASHGKRKTVNAMDVVYALKKHGRTLYTAFEQDA